MLVTEGRILNNVAYIYDLLSPLMILGEGRVLNKKVFTLLDLKGKERILDIGCGTGNLTIFIYRRLKELRGNSYVVGLDAAENMIKIARRKIKGINNIHFDYALAEDLPYPDSYFDTVVSSFFFHHINFLLKKRVLAEVWRVLKPKGVFMIIDIDIPTNIFGLFLGYCGYLLFRQEEIRDNLKGGLRRAIEESKFKYYQILFKTQGYISVFKLIKEG